MTANKNLLRMKFARVIEAYARHQACSLDDALKAFYQSETYVLMRDGIADMHCMSIPYLVEELAGENAEISSSAPPCAGGRNVIEYSQNEKDER